MPQRKPYTKTNKWYRSKHTQQQRKLGESRSLGKKNAKRISGIMTTAPVKGPFSSYGGKDPFRPSYHCTLHYAESTIISVGTAGLFGTEVIYRLNSLFDPRYAVGGNKPYGFNQLATLYRRYVVSSVTMQLIFNDPDRDGLVFGATIQPSLGVATVTGKSIEVVKEQPMSITRSVNNTGDQLATVNQTVKMYQIEGLAPVQYKCDLENYSAAVGADPTKTPLLRVAIADGNLGSAGSAQFRVILKYHCSFFDRITQAQST